MWMKTHGDLKLIRKKINSKYVGTDARKLKKKLSIKKWKKLESNCRTA